MKNLTLKSKDVDFSSEEMKERFKKVRLKQEKIRKSGNPPSLEQMRKITFTI